MKMTSSTMNNQQPGHIEERQDVDGIVEVWAQSAGVPQDSEAVSKEQSQCHAGSFSLN